MKKMLFACTLILGGIIGTVGCLMACALSIETGAITNVVQTINTPEEIIIFCFFMLMAVVGLLYGIKLLNSKS